MSLTSITRNASVILIVALLTVGDAQDCVPRDFGYGSIVCVCNSTYCDLAAIHIPEKGYYQSYESDKSGNRFRPHTGRIDDIATIYNDVARIPLTLDPDVKYQAINGFGGAFTDSAGINIKRLSDNAQDKLIEAYYSVNGSGYSLGRVPIGGTDFSTRAYTLDDDMGDVTLQRFGLANEDYQYKIPIMQKARQHAPYLRFVSAAWSAPGWMKTNNRTTGGFLSADSYQVYADYLVRFLVEYKRQGLDIWAVSTGNEPTDTYLPRVMKFETMGWTPTTMARWVANNLGPTIANSESNETLILMLDDQRFDLPWYVDDVFQNAEARKYIAGVAVHWYYDLVITPNVLDATNLMHPDKFLLLTEACAGSNPWDFPKVRLGDWSRGEAYILDIIENLNHWMTGWIDWNIVLDRQGGPNYVENYVDAPVIVNPETDEFFKQPTYYAIAHFSKFLEPGSVRIGITTAGPDVDAIAFLSPMNLIIVVLANPTDEEILVTIVDPEQGNIPRNLPPHSMQSMIYSR